MKRLLLVLFLLLLPALAYAGAAIKFDAEEHDFGTVRQGELLHYAFRFTNTGDAELSGLKTAES